ncbi:MAG: ATP-binding protein [Phormidesmis sp.]
MANPFLQFFSQPDKPAFSKDFKLLRNFSIISLSGFFISTVFLSVLYRQQTEHDLIRSTEESNVALTQVLANTLWSEYGGFLGSIHALDKETLATDSMLRKISEELASQVKGSTIAKIKVFDLNGRIIISTDTSQIGGNKSQSEGFLAAKTGQVVSQLEHKDISRALRRHVGTRHLLSTYMPIRADISEGEIIGVFEVYTNVTPVLLRIQQTQQAIVQGSLLILTVLYAILFLFVRKAEKLLSRQYQQVQNSEVRYRHQSNQLEKALVDLQQAQLRMVQSEKMSSLGRMVAGVAHEINNPINFIHGNLRHVEGYVHNLLAFLRLYEAGYPNPDKTIQAQAEELEIDFVKEDLSKTLSSMTVGTKRIREVVLSLRRFSHMDQSGFKEADIHAGIESTLTILQHRLETKADQPAICIVRDYGDLPPLKCHAGQINQVLMNLLDNGIDALKEDLDSSENKNVQKTPRITIRTETRSEHILISIADNGIGISPNHKERIFEPFFTTKAIGRGTGLGLAIAHQLIVENHKGKIECFSSEGVMGTEFVIELPIQTETPSAAIARGYQRDSVS